MKRLFGVVVCVMLLVNGCMLLLPLQAIAAPATISEGFNIITSPLPIKLTTDPGRTVTTDLRMKNQGTQPEDIKVGLMKFGASGDSGQPEIQDLTAKDDYSSWVHFDPQQFTAEPGVWKTVHMTIDVPRDAALGYYLAVTFSRASQPGVKAANFRGAVATLVLLEVNSASTKRQLNVLDFTASHGLYEYLPVTFNVKLHNGGNIHLAPSGNIFIERNSQPVSNITFNQAGGSILPDSTRLFRVTWDDGFPVFRDKLLNGKPVPGKHADPQQKLTWNFGDVSKFRFGRYTAKLLVIYDNGQQDIPLESQVAFWVLPWKLLLIVFLIVLVVGFGIWNASRSFMRSAKQGVGKRRAPKD